MEKNRPALALGVRIGAVSALSGKLPVAPVECFPRLLSGMTESIHERRDILKVDIKVVIEIHKGNAPGCG